MTTDDAAIRPLTDAEPSRGWQATVVTRGHELVEHGGEEPVLGVGERADRRVVGRHGRPQSNRLARLRFMVSPM